MMKKLRVMTGAALILTAVPLAACSPAVTAYSLVFIVTYDSKDGLTAFKEGILIDGKNKISASTFRLDLSRIESVKYYTTSGDDMFGKTVNGSDLRVGDLLTLRLSEAVDLSKLSRYKFLDKINAATGRNGGRSGARIKNGKVHCGDEIAYGDFEFSTVPLFVGSGDRVIDPQSLAEGTPGYAGYYKYGQNEKYRYIFPFVLK